MKMNPVIQCFMNGQGMDRQEAEDNYRELLAEMRIASDSKCYLHEMDEVMHQYGLEPDYADTIVFDLMAEVTA